MRIAVFYNLFFGGAKRVVHEQVKGLKKRGNNIDVYTTDETVDFLDLSKVADNFYVYKTFIEKFFIFIGGRLGRDIYSFFFLRLLHKKISQIIDEKKYDIVLVHPDRVTQAPYLLKYLKTPSVYYCEEPLRIVYEYSLRFKDVVPLHKKLYEELTRLMRKKIDRENTRSATHCIASCCHIRERMIESYDVYSDVCYPGIDVKRFKPEKIKKQNQVLFIGNKDVVTDGFDLAKEAMEKIPIYIRPELFILEWKKENLERITEHELVNIYNSSIASLCLSKLETFGLVPLESMACGVPVIATNVSGHRETVVSGKTGFLVEFDPEQIAEKITLFIKNPLLAKKMGKIGRKHVVREWVWDKRVDDLEEKLNKYIKKSKV